MAGKRLVVNIHLDQARDGGMDEYYGGPENQMMFSLNVSGSLEDIAYIELMHKLSDAVISEHKKFFEDRREGR